MERLLLMDEKNYAHDLPEICRTAVRGIISLDGRLLFIKSKYGEVKLPGGGREEGESDLDTLIREVREETGFEVSEKLAAELTQLSIALGAVEAGTDFAGLVEHFGK